MEWNRFEAKPIEACEFIRVEIFSYRIRWRQTEIGSQENFDFTIYLSSTFWRLFVSRKQEVTLDVY